MNKKLARFVLPVLMFAFVGAAQAAQQTFTFEQKPSFFTIDPFEVYRIDTTLPEFNFGGYKSMAELSGNSWVATTWLGAEKLPASFSSSSGKLFSLDALWLSAATGTLTVTIVGFDATGGKVSEISLDIGMTAQQFTFTDFVGISKFTIQGSNYVQDESMKEIDKSGWNWAVGSVTITSSVPEPEAYAMLLAGLGLIGAMARRRQRV